MYAEISQESRREIVRTVSRLTADLRAIKHEIYLTDFLLSYTVFAIALYLATTAESIALTSPAVMVATIALYRAACFLHELVHACRSATTIKVAWNILLGIPLLLPHYFYLDHSRHHAPATFGGERDPEYRKFSREPRASVVLYVLHPLVTPFLLLLRFLLLVPVAWISKRARTNLDRYASRMTIRFPMDSSPTSASNRNERIVEVICVLWSYIFVVLFAAGFISARFLTVFFVVLTLAQVLNTMRTLVSHRYDVDEHQNETGHDALTQFGDSYNFGKWPLLAEIWAPVGLRYHALHHLVPHLPYHSLPEAHRRLSSFGWYATANAPGFWRVLGNVAYARR
jgi:fatty acid desaturase